MVVVVGGGGCWSDGVSPCGASGGVLQHNIFKMCIVK